MNPAKWPRPRPLEERLLVLDAARGAIGDARVGDLPQLLGLGDLVVVNDAATLPSSLRARNAEVEVRLCGALPTGTEAGATAGATVFRAVTFGAGDWRTPTEKRPAPPTVKWLDFGGGLSATVEPLKDAISPRLVSLRFSFGGADLMHALYHHARPVQYAYLDASLELWHTQTAYAAAPWSFEQPSAGRPLTVGMLIELRRRGAQVARLTHAAGLSSTGDAELDAALPLAERYQVPAETMNAVLDAKRVIAVGTTVVRALESAARSGVLEGETTLRLDGGHRLRAVHGIFTGLHEPGTSHAQLLEAFAKKALLDAAWLHAEERGYLQHEFGDSMLLTT
jgi:S-adenosylmethionine:tRNA ribosyltransferase-isomerase